MRENVYYYPEKVGLEVVANLDQPDLGYEFHILMICRDPKSGKLVWAEDSGCSCPCPFESFYFNSIEDTNLNIGPDKLRETIEAFPADEFSKSRALETLAGEI